MKCESRYQKYGEMMNLNESEFKKLDSEYPIKMSNHLENLISQNKSESLIKQFLPSVEEFEHYNRYEYEKAFYPDEMKKTAILYQKYPNRAIIYVTNRCEAHCRFCNRKSMWKNKTDFFNEKKFDEAIEWLMDNKSIREVIVTGGDPLTLNDNELDYLLQKLRTVPWIINIRIGTRIITTNPKRITNDLCDIFAKHSPIIITTQINHIDEISKDSELAIKRVRSKGVLILNQSVLLKNVNDDYNTLKSLLEKCASMNIVPYYLFHCSNIKSIQHFRTDVMSGVKLIDQLMHNIGSWMLPKYCLIPSETGAKIHLQSNPVVELEKEKLILNDYLQREVEYY